MTKSMGGCPDSSGPRIPQGLPQVPGTCGNEIKQPSDRVREATARPDPSQDDGTLRRGAYEARGVVGFA
ncbi:MAG: hypothetical protein ACI9OJ_002082 [Myxococcota bacterium]|jgi:hypothetical protein